MRKNNTCDHCVKRKRKCDRGKPCSNCIAAKIECVYSESKPKAGDTQRELEERLKRLESLLSEAYSNTSPYSSETSILPLQMEHMDVNKPTLKTERDLTDELRKYLFEKDHDDLLDLALLYQNSPYSCLHEEYIRTSAKSLHPLKYILYSFGSLIARPDMIPEGLNNRIEMSHVYYEKAVSYFPLLISNPTVTGVLAMVYIFHTAARLKKDHECQIYFASTLDTAKELGINNEESLFNLSPFDYERENIRSIWWIMYQLDSYLIEKSKNLIRDSDNQIYLPMNSELLLQPKDKKLATLGMQVLNSNEWYTPGIANQSLTTYKILLYRIYRKVLKLFSLTQKNAIKDCNYIVGTLQASLSEWKCSLPDYIDNHIQILQNNLPITDPKTTWFVAQLLIHHNEIRNLLNTPFLLRRLVRETEHLPKIKIFNDSIKIAHDNAKLLNFPLICASKLDLPPPHAHHIRESIDIHIKCIQNHCLAFGKSNTISEMAFQLMGKATVAQMAIDYANFRYQGKFPNLPSPTSNYSATTPELLAQSNYSSGSNSTSSLQDVSRVHIDVQRTSDMNLERSKEGSDSISPILEKKISFNRKPRIMSNMNQSDSNLLSSGSNSVSSLNSLDISLDLNLHERQAFTSILSPRLFERHTPPHTMFAKEKKNDLEERLQKLESVLSSGYKNPFNSMDRIYHGISELYPHRIVTVQPVLQLSKELQYMLFEQDRDYLVTLAFTPRLLKDLNIPDGYIRECAKENPILKYALYCAGSLYAQPGMVPDYFSSRLEMAKAYMDKTTSFITSIMTRPSIFGVLALIFISITANRLRREGEGYLYYSLALTIAKEVGINNEEAIKTLANHEQEREIIRNIWWFLYLIDSKFYEKNLQLIKEDSNQISLPGTSSMENSLNSFGKEIVSSKGWYTPGIRGLSAHAYHILLLRIHGKVLSFHYQSRNKTLQGTSLYVMGCLEGSISEWRRCLPENISSSVYLIQSNNDILDVENTWYSVNIIFRSIHTKVLIYMPTVLELLVVSNETLQDTPYFHDALATASEGVDVLKNILAKNSQFYMCDNLFSALVFDFAFLFLCALRIDFFDVDTQLAQENFNISVQCIKLYSMARERVPFLADVLENLLTLTDLSQIAICYAQIKSQGEYPTYPEAPAQNIGEIFNQLCSSVGTSEDQPMDVISPMDDSVSNVTGWSD
ncbi:hypothetical protein HDV01_006939 [Terramyces sp. JEL0728]|nr:hypothetical protein HDV01_006939 [Terramyces sp. JEL0728]